jgi:hypothetical protein
VNAGLRFRGCSRGSGERTFNLLRRRTTTVLRACESKIRASMLTES